MQLVKVEEWDRGQRTTKCDDTYQSIVRYVPTCTYCQRARAITAGAVIEEDGDLMGGPGVYEEGPALPVRLFFFRAVSLTLPHFPDQIFHPMIDSLLLLRAYGNLFTHSSQHRLLS